jgi:branched-chain amino acid transport system permease protein
MQHYIELFVFGITTGALFGLLALGVVMIYRSTGVLNLAHGAMAMAPAYVTYTLNKRGLPVALAALLALVFAALLGLAVERLMRPLRDRPVLTRVVMTVGILLLVTAIFEKIYTTDPRLAPSLLPLGHTYKVPLLSIRISLEDIGIVAITIILSIALAAFFRRSSLGVAMRAASENRQAATLMGVNPDLVSSLAWGMGSVLAGIAGILLSPHGMQPFTLVLLAVPAFIASLLAGLESLPGAVIGAAVVGILYYELPQLPLIRSGPSGMREIGIFAIAIIFLTTRVSRLQTDRA